MLRRIKYKISHTKFCLVYPLVLFTSYNAINIDKLTKWFTVKDGLDVVGFAAYLLTALTLFISFFVLVAHRRTTKLFAILIVVLSAAATYFIAKYNVAVDSSMILNVVNTDPTEASGLLSVRMLPYVLFLILVPTAIILAGEITYEPGRRYLLSSAKLFVAAFVISIGSLYLNHNAINRALTASAKYVIYSLVPINVIQGSLNATYKSLKPHFTSKKVIDIQGKVTSNDDLIVALVVGESARQKNFSLYGYKGKDTNPVLGQVSGLHLLNGFAKKGSTLIALPEILEKSDVKLAEVAFKLGVPTACLVNFTMYNNCDAVGEIMVSNCKYGKQCYDEDVIPLLKENLRSHTAGKQLTILHLGGGSHGPIYKDRYPPDFQKFQPMCHDADVSARCTEAELYNSYDNSILYTDYVLGGVISTLESTGKPYVMIYLSDHGESLMEEGRLFHGVPPGMALPKEQADIPLIVKSSVPISITPRDTYTQPDVFDTVLDLLSIETPLFNKQGSFIKIRPPVAPAGSVAKGAGQGK